MSAQAVMAAKFRKVDPRIWRDEKFRRLDPDHKLIALYCLTSGQCNRIGIFCFSEAMAAEETETLPKTFAERFGNVCRTLKWEWDSVAKVLFFPHWWKYNLPDNANIFRACLDDLHDLPETQLVKQFASICHTLPETFRAKIETLPQTLRVTLGERSAPGAGAGTGGGEGAGIPKNGKTKKQEDNPFVPAEFDITAAGIAQHWCMLTTNRFNGGPNEKLADATLFIGEMLRTVDAAYLLEKVTDKKRSKNQSLRQFAAEIEKNGKPPPSRESQEESASKQELERIANERIREEARAQPKLGDRYKNHQDNKKCQTETENTQPPT